MAEMSTPRAPARAKASAAAANPARDDVATGAYWLSIRLPALADHGMISASRSSQSVPSPVPKLRTIDRLHAAARAGLRSSSVRGRRRGRCGSISRRCRLAADAEPRASRRRSSRHSAMTAREPMCFSSQHDLAPRRDRGNTQKLPPGAPASPRARWSPRATWSAADRRAIAAQSRTGS